MNTYVVNFLLGVLLLQGITLLVRHKDTTWYVWVGLLTLSIFSVALVGTHLLQDDGVVMAREFHALYTHGNKEWRLRGYILLQALFVGLLLQTGRVMRDARRQPETAGATPYPSRAWRVVQTFLLAFGVATLSAFECVRPIGGAADTELSVYRCDLFAPYLLLWQAACVLEWLLIVLEIGHARTRVFLTTVFLMACSALGVSQPKSFYADPLTHEHWSRCLAFFAPLVIVQALRVLLPGYFERKAWLQRVLWSLWLIDERKQFSEQDTEARQTALSCFRLATERDPGFAFAHYRLAQALEQDGESSAADAALRAAIQANPHFGAAHNALARLLATRYGRYNASCPLRQPETNDLSATQDGSSREARTQRARAAWQRVIAAEGDFPSEYDRGSAYFGLCQLHRLDSRHESETQQRAFYFCSRAKRIYAQLSGEVVPARELLATRAAVSDELGVILLNKLPEETPTDDDQPWVCAGNMIRPCSGSESCTGWSVPRYPRAAEAKPHLARAHELNPDDLAIQCHLALAEGAQGEWERMATLEASSNSQLMLGQQLFEGAQDVAVSDPALSELQFDRAFASFERAIELEPHNLDALNSYAYTYRVWRLMPNDSVPSDPDVANKRAELAETYAHTATRLAPQRRSGTDTAIMKSTLGEVLLARGRPHEAIAVLEAALDEAPSHAQYNEIPWDLMQAYHCAREEDLSYEAQGRSAPMHPGCKELPQKMARLEARMRASEAHRESQTFTGSALEHLPACHLARGPALADEMDTTITTLTCKGSTLYFAASSADGPILRMHVWGRRLDSWLRAGESLALEMPAAGDSTERYAFELWKDVDDVHAKERVSLVREFESPNAGGTCMKIQASAAKAGSASRKPFFRRAILAAAPAPSVAEHAVQ